MTCAIHSREVSGLQTSLRQLHRIADLSQPEALKVIDQLERAGIVVIAANMGDAFESTITLKDEARRRMDRAVASKAA